MKIVSSVEAQNHFGELLDNAQREPISITRRGRPVAYIVSTDTYRALAKRVAEPSQTAAYLEAVAAFHGSGKKGATKALLADRVAERKRKP